MQKWCLICALILEVTFSGVFFRASLGKFGQKSFSPPNTLSATPPINSYEIKQHGYAQKGLKIFALASEN